MEMTPEALEAIREIINLGVGKAAGRLNVLLETQIRLYAPEIFFATLKDFASLASLKGASMTSCVLLGFRGEIQGTAIMVFAPEDALALTRVLCHENMADENMTDDDTIVAYKAGTLTEVGNIVMVCILGTMGNCLQQHFSFDLPTYLEGNLPHIVGEGLLRFEPAVLVVKTCFEATEFAIEGKFLLLFELHSFDRFLEMTQRLEERSDLIL